MKISTEDTYSTLHFPFLKSEMNRFYLCTSLHMLSKSETAVLPNSQVFIRLDNFNFSTIKCVDGREMQAVNMRT